MPGDYYGSDQGIWMPPAQFGPDHEYELIKLESHTSRLAKKSERERAARETKRAKEILGDTLHDLQKLCMSSQGSAAATGGKSTG